MKIRLLMIATLALTICNLLKAEDKVTISDFKISAGETKELSITMNNDAAYVAFQFDLYLPEGLTVETYNANRSRLPESTTLSMSQQEDGSYRFLSAAMGSEQIVGNSGGIVSISVKASEGLTSGEVAGYFRKVKLSKANATGPTYSEMSFPITIIEPSVVTATSVSRAYGEANPTFEYTVTGGALEGTPLITCEATSSSTVGEYPISIAKGSVTNYNVTYVKGTLTITKAPLTVTAKNYTIKQGDALPTFEATYSGFKNNETSSVLTTQPSFSCNATSSSVPGTYDIFVSNAAATNYEISYENGSLTVTPGTYTLKYIVDGDEYKSCQIEYGTTITPEVTPTKEGYTFSGWSNIPATMPAHDVTVSGTFSKGAYKLIYKVDGEVYKTINYDYGTTITSEAEPTKEGFTFSGWSEIPSTMPANDVTVTGTFIINKYKLTYMVDGEEYRSFEIEYGASVSPEAEPSKEGHTFSGWSNIPATMPANDVTVTGSFTINKYKLTYVVDSDEYQSYQIEYGATITPEAEPTKEGYSFSGWSNIPATMPAHDVTVSGTFSKGAYKLIYKVDGEVYKTINYDYGTTITSEAEPTKEGFTFSGWSEIPSTMPANDVTVTGTFTVNKYKLIYMVDGEVYRSFEIEYGASISPEAEPSKEGYTFSGWSTIPITMPAKDVTVLGSYTQVEYKVDDVTYEITGEGEVAITGGNETGEVTIESSVEINGQTYQVTGIAENAFKDNQDITSLTIPEGITTIGDNAFDGCVGLLVINVGKDVQSIGSQAFANVGTASAVRTRSEEGSLVVNCYTESVPQTASNAFENTPIETGTLFVVDNQKSAFMATSPWNGFGKIVGFEEAAGINSITIGTEDAWIFDIQGNRLDDVRKGVNIIRTRDGKTKKVVVK